MRHSPKVLIFVAGLLLADSLTVNGTNYECWPAYSPPAGDAELRVFVHSWDDGAEVWLDCKQSAPADESTGAPN